MPSHLYAVFSAVKLPPTNKPRQCSVAWLASLRFHGCHLSHLLLYIPSHGLFSTPASCSFLAAASDNSFESTVVPCNSFVYEPSRSPGVDVPCTSAFSLLVFKISPSGLLPRDPLAAASLLGFLCVAKFFIMIVRRHLSSSILRHCYGRHSFVLQRGGHYYMGSAVKIG